MVDAFWKLHWSWKKAKSSLAKFSGCIGGKTTSGLVQEAVQVGLT